MKKSGEIRQICQFRQIRQIRQIRQAWQAWQAKHLNKHLRESDGRSAKVFADSRLYDFISSVFRGIRNQTAVNSVKHAVKHARGYAVKHAVKTA